MRYFFVQECFVENAFVRIVNAKDQKEVVRYDLSEDFSVETAITMAQLYRDRVNNLYFGQR